MQILKYRGREVGSVGPEQRGRAGERATMQVTGSGRLTAADQVTVEGTDRSETFLYDQASGTFNADACVVTHDRTEATVMENATVLAFGRSRITAFGAATVTLHDSAECDVRDPQVTVHDNRIGGDI